MNSTSESKMLSYPLRDVVKGHTHLKYSNRIPAKNTREDTNSSPSSKCPPHELWSQNTNFCKKAYEIFVQEKDAVIYQDLFLIPCYGLTCVPPKFIG